MAGTSMGTSRRRAVELRALEQAALRSTPSFRQLPRAQRKKMIAGVHRRARGLRP